MELKSIINDNDTDFFLDVQALFPNGENGDRKMEVIYELKYPPMSSNMAGWKSPLE